MNFSRAFGFVALLAFSQAAGHAGHAPLPTPTDSGKNLNITITAGASHDSNLFGAASNAIDSMVYRLAPKLAYEGSLNDQTFVSTSYQLNADYFDSRPGEKELYGHELMARLAHAFSPVTNADITDSFGVVKNPEALLAGIPLNTEQSFQRNQLDGRFTTAPMQKTGLTVKARSIYYKYDGALLGRSLDRMESLFGLSGDYALLPQTKIVAEYRHQEVAYENLSDNKDKQSDFFLTGADYAAGRKLSASTRLGVEFRRRSGERSDTVPFVEVSGKFDHVEDGFVSAGYVYTLEESSDIVRFTDTQVSRFFANAQHPLSPRIFASGSLTYEPSQLQGRRGVANLDEDVVRLGVALAYVAAKNWTAAVTYDYDRVDSDDASRQQTRHRVGLTGTLAF